MVWKCQMTLVLGEGMDGEIISLERSSNDCALGLQLAWIDLMKQLSTLDDRRTKAFKTVQVLGWADRVLIPELGTDALRSQRLVDHTARVELGAQAVSDEQQKSER